MPHIYFISIPKLLNKEENSLTFEKLLQEFNEKQEMQNTIIILQQ